MNNYATITKIYRKERIVLFVMARIMVKSSQAIVFFLAALIAFSLLVCGTASADLAYINDDGRVTYINSQGTEQVTDIEAGSVLSFNHNGRPRILITGRSESDIISIYDPENFSAPLASADIFPDTWTVITPTYIAEFGSNIIVAANNVYLLEINPETCQLVGSYDGDVGTVHSYGGQLVAQAFVEQENNGSASYGYVKAITMDSLGHITGTFDGRQYDYSVDGPLAVSGGELYYALGKNSFYLDDFEANYHGIYRVSKMIGNMDVSNAEKITDDMPGSICMDGKGGLYYTVWYSEDDNYTTANARYIYHWNGTSSSLVYDAEDKSVGDDMNSNALHYDTTSGILYAYINGQLTALVPDSSGQLTVSEQFPVYAYYSDGNKFVVVGNPSEGSGGSVTPAPDTLTPTPNNNAQPDSSGDIVTPTPGTDTQSQTQTLPSGIIEPPVITSRDVLERLAELVSIDASRIQLITQDNISSPTEPTQSMKDYIKNDGYEAAYKFNTLNVSADGYYVFLVNVPDELVGTKVSDVKLYALRNADFASSFFSLINGVLNYGELTNLLGVKIDTLEKQVLAVGFLQAGTPFSVYLAKIILALLAGGCDSGLGFAALCVLIYVLHIL